MLSVPVSSLATRAVALFAFWVVLIASGPSRPGAADLVAGAVVAAVATWVSVRLLPGPQVRLNLPALARLAGHFLWQSMRAGIDVAHRAFSPRLPLKTGTITYRAPTGSGIESGIHSGIGRDLFTAMTSLLPGTVPLGPPLRIDPVPSPAIPRDAGLEIVGTAHDSESIEYHCLDVGQPIAAQLDREATLLSRALGLDVVTSRAAPMMDTAPQERSSS